MALVVDYDGTLACDGNVRSKTIDALIKIKKTGRKLVMVTGRRLDNLKQIFNRLDLFDRVVAENGALIYTPQTQSQVLLDNPPSTEFIEQLKNRNVEPLFIGNVIIATTEPNEITILEVIRDMGLSLDIIFNKGAVMVLPSGINKETGLSIALKELDLSMHNVVGIGDGENDHVFLRKLALSVAVADACGNIRKNADLVTKGTCGEGVEEIIKKMIANESELVSKIKYKVCIGKTTQGIPVQMKPDDRILIAGNSGIGKSTMATALTEKMYEHGFQFCVFDPEGDYEKLENAVVVGDMKSVPPLEPIIELLKDTYHNVVVNTLGVDIKERPFFFIQLSTKLTGLKHSTGHPHWLIIDEAHHLIPASQETISLPKEGVILITVHPDEIAIDVLKTLNVIIILGPQAIEIMQRVSKIIGEPLPQQLLNIPMHDEVLIWQRSPISSIETIKIDKPQQQHKRHTRKYALGNLQEEYSFFFRGPKNALRLKAQNLTIFLQIADGIDDDTWMYHLKRKDYSEWFQVHIKDNVLAKAASKIESDNTLSPAQSRQAIANLVKEMYTAPASEKD